MSVEEILAREHECLVHTAKIISQIISLVHLIGLKKKKNVKKPDN